MRKFSVSTLLLVVCLAGVVAPKSVDAASRKLTVTGKVKSAGDQTLAVLLVGHDGTSVRVPVAANGSFAVKVPATIVSKMSTRKKGKGPTLHIVKSGEYAGPIVLARKGTKGYARLIASANGTLKVGTVTLRGKYATSNAKQTVIDSSVSIRLKSGAPVSAFSIREQMVMGPVRSFAAIVKETTVSGADSDRDGLPNFADADLNGDGVLDAAQPDSSVTFDSSAGEIKKVDTPSGRFAFQKQLTHPQEVEVNSNANPNVTSEQIFAYLTKNMSVSMSVQMQANEIADTTVLVDCRKLSYCSLGSKSMVRGAPGSAVDGKELATLQNADGLIVMPQREGENMRMLRFYPGAASASEAALAGDTFELILQKNGITTFSTVYVVTSSFVTPMSVTSMNGTPIKVLDKQDSGLVLGADRKISLTFYRPQSFKTGSTSELLDRGGMTYLVSLRPQNGSNTGYICPASALSNLSSTLVAKPAEPYPGFFDTEQVPSTNGAVLGFTVDASKCPEMGTGAMPTFASGSKWIIELMARDSDDNTADVEVMFTAG